MTTNNDVSQLENEFQTGIGLEELYLDPNNYRFKDNKSYNVVDNDNITDLSVQRQTRIFIEGKNQENIKDLLSSFKSNGFLNVDLIQITKIQDNKYLVIEGNRRIAALKHMHNLYLEGHDLGKMNPSIFQNIPYEEVISEDKENSLIVMGLKHISGNKKWAAINQSQLIYDYLKDSWGDEDLYNKKELELSQSLGISMIKLRTMQRAYHLIQAYRASDYGDQFSSDQYSIFEEIVKKPKIREWLDWDMNKYVCRSMINEERLFSWLSCIELEDSNDNQILTDEDCERRPIITKAFEIRDLATIIDNESALKILEETYSMTQAIIHSGVEGRATIENAKNELGKSISVLSKAYDELDEKDIMEIKGNTKKFPLLFSGKSNLEIYQVNSDVIFTHSVSTHLSHINIEKYKMYNNFVLNNLSRINIFVGENNSGKTSILESIYLLAALNDFEKYLELIKMRYRKNSIEANLLEKIMPKNMKISASFNSSQISLEIKQESSSAVEKYDDYLFSVNQKCKVNDDLFDSTTHIYKFNNLKREYTSIKNICNIQISGPYHNDMDKLIVLYDKALKTRVVNKNAYSYVLEFIKEIDPSISNIYLTEDGGIKEFLVDVNAPKNITTTLNSYGSGISRIFEMGLSIVSARNGILLIDEFEAAVHYSLLNDFTYFLYKLAIDLNVQIFCTTHSKECIDAFVSKEDVAEEISAYLLTNDGFPKFKYTKGKALKEYIELVDLDIRGGK